MMDDINDIKIEEENTNIEDKLKKLKEKLKKCQKEKEEYLDGWQRTKADFINARREEEERRKDFIKLSNQLLIADILSVLDSLDLAVQSQKNKENDITDGVYLIKLQLQDVLKKYGLEVMKTKGEKFDPKFHEAIEEVESKKESGTIIEEVQKGYKLDNKVLRPARVKITK